MYNTTITPAVRKSFFRKFSNLLLAIFDEIFTVCMLPLLAGKCRILPVSFKKFFYQLF